MSCFFSALPLTCCPSKTAGSALIPLPRKVIYVDLITDWNKPQQTILDASDAGFNVIVLAFYLSTVGPYDAAGAWGNLSPAVQRATIDAVHAKGGIVMVSLGGATDSPYARDPAGLGTEVGKWCVANLLDGVDFDLEGINPGFTHAPHATAQQLIGWMNALNASTRAAIGPGRSISHAPQAPYLSVPGAQGTWPGPTGGYAAVFLAGNVDWLNVQYYNQGASCYQNYQGIFQTACASFPTSAISQLQAAGIPYDRLVLGMPVLPTDGNQPFPSASTVHDMVVKAGAELGWNAGVFAWQYHAGGSAGVWLSTVYPAATRQRPLLETLCEWTGCA